MSIFALSRKGFIFLLNVQQHECSHSYSYYHPTPTQSFNFLSSARVFFNNLCCSQLPFLVQVSNRICIFLCSYTFPIESLFRTMFGIKFTAPSLRMRYLDIFQVLFHSQNTNQFFQFSQILLSFQTLGFLLKFLSFLSEF